MNFRMAMFRAKKSWTRHTHLFAIATIVVAIGGDLHVIFFCVLAFSSLALISVEIIVNVNFVSDSFFLYRNSREPPLFRYLLIATEVEKLQL